MQQEGCFRPPGVLLTHGRHHEGGELVIVLLGDVVRLLPVETLAVDDGSGHACLF